jgi:hypothetical protein
MKKSLRFLLTVFCFAITLFYMVQHATAAPAVSKEAYKPKSAVNETQNRPCHE